MSHHVSTPSLILSAAMLSGAASAAEPVTVPAAPGQSESVGAQAGNAQTAYASKARLVKLLLDQSPAVLRIPQSGNAQAKQELAEAQAAYARAGREAQAGRLEAAVAELDGALKRIVSASHLVPDTQQVAAQERARYAALGDAIRTFQGRYKDGTAAGGKAVPASELAHIAALVEKAGTQAAGGALADANATLARAYALVVAALNRALASETIVYNASFSSPDEEYRYELARNQSYEELIPIALAQLQSPRETAALSDRYTQQSRTLRATARSQADGGDHRGAVKTMQEATGHLQKALRIAGLVVPQSDMKP